MIEIYKNHLKKRYLQNTLETEKFILLCMRDGLDGSKM